MVVVVVLVMIGGGVGDDKDISLNPSAAAKGKIKTAITQFE